MLLLSSGHKRVGVVEPSPPPGTCSHFFFAHRMQHSHCLSTDNNYDVPKENTYMPSMIYSRYAYMHIVAKQMSAKKSVVARMKLYVDRERKLPHDSKTDDVPAIDRSKLTSQPSKQAFWLLLLLLLHYYFLPITIRNNIVQIPEAAASGKQKQYHHRTTCMHARTWLLLLAIDARPSSSRRLIHHHHHQSPFIIVIGMHVWYVPFTSNKRFVFTVNRQQHNNQPTCPGWLPIYNPAQSRHRCHHRRQHPELFLPLTPTCIH